MFSLTPAISPFRFCGSTRPAGHLAHSCFCTGFSWHVGDVKGTYSLYDRHKQVLLTGLGGRLTGYKKAARRHEWKQTSCGRSRVSCAPSHCVLSKCSGLDTHSRDDAPPNLMKGNPSENLIHPSLFQDWKTREFDNYTEYLERETQSIDISITNNL